MGFITGLLVIVAFHAGTYTASHNTHHEINKNKEVSVIKNIDKKVSSKVSEIKIDGVEVAMLEGSKNA